MSSKVLGGEGAQAQRIVWRKLSNAAPSTAVSGPAAGPVIDACDTESLRAKLAQTLTDAEVREKRARQQGYQEGEASAAQKGAQQHQQTLQRIARSIEETVALRLRMRQQMEEDLIHLAVAIARRILHRELTVDPEALLGIVKASLRRMDTRELLRARVAPPDAKMLGQHVASLNLPSRVEITPDPSLEPGSVVLETSRGSIDASIETQLDEIDRGFADLVRRHTP